MRDGGNGAMNRRDFLSRCSVLVAGGALVASKTARGRLLRQEGEIPRLWEPLSEAEQAALERSRFADVDVPGHVRQGYFCGEILLLHVLDGLGKPRGWVDMAAGIRDGFGKRDRCCLLTGGIMAIGLAAGVKHEVQREKSAYALELVDEWWTWWGERAPLDCGDIRPNCMGEGYPRMWKRAAMKMENMMEAAGIWG